MNFKNKARTVLTADISATDTVITVGDASRLPEPPCVVSIDDEVLFVVQRQGNTLKVMRGMEDTQPAPHKAGAFVEQRLTAGILKALLEETAKIKKAVVPGMKKLLVFYAYPRAVNGTWSVDGAAAAFAQYDIVVLPENLELPNHHDYSVARQIIEKAKERNPDILFFGYIRLPMIYHTGIGGSVSEFRKRVSSWINVHRVDGIFLDEYGFDYFVHFGYHQIYPPAGNQNPYVVFPWARTMQNTALDIVHDFNVPVIVNAWDPQSVWSTAGGMEEAHWWVGQDYYLLESVPCYFAEQGGVRNEWAHAGDLWYRTYLCISDEHYGRYRPRLLGVGTVNPEVVPESEFETFYTTRYYIALGMAYALGFEAFGLERVYYYANNPKLLPLLPDEIGVGDYKHKIQYNYAANVSYTTSSGNTYNNLAKYWFTVPIGEVVGYYKDGREPVYLKFGNYYEYEIDKGLIWKKEPYYSLNKLKTELSNLFQRVTTPSNKPNNFSVSLESVYYSETERKATVKLALASPDSSIQGYSVSVVEGTYERSFTVSGRYNILTFDVFWAPADTSNKTITVKTKAFTFDNVFSDEMSKNFQINYPSQAQTVLPGKPTINVFETLGQSISFGITVQNQHVAREYALELSTSPSFTQVEQTKVLYAPEGSLVVPTSLFDTSPKVFYLRARARNVWNYFGQYSDIVSVQLEKNSANVEQLSLVLTDLSRQLSSTKNQALILNSYFLGPNNEPSTQGWEITGEGQLVEVVGIRGPYAFENSANKSARLLSGFIPVDKSQAYVLEAYVRAKVLGNCKPRLIVLAYDKNRQQIGTSPIVSYDGSNSFVLPTTNFAFLFVAFGYGTDIPLPNDAVYIRIGVDLNSTGAGAGNAVHQVQGINLRQVVNGLYIHDLDAKVIKAASITSDKIAAGSITSEHISSKSITAEKLNIDDLSAVRANTRALVVTSSNERPTPEPGKIKITDGVSTYVDISNSQVRLVNGNDFLILSASGVVSNKPIITDPSQIAPGIIPTAQSNVQTKTYANGSVSFTETLSLVDESKYVKVSASFSASIPNMCTRLDEAESGLESTPGSVYVWQTYTFDSEDIFSHNKTSTSEYQRFDLTINSSSSVITNKVPTSITLQAGVYDVWCGTYSSPRFIASNFTATRTSIVPNNPTVYWEFRITGLNPSSVYVISTPNTQTLYAYINSQWMLLSSGQVTVTGVDSVRFRYSRAYSTVASLEPASLSITVSKVPTNSTTIAFTPIYGGILKNYPDTEPEPRNLVPSAANANAWAIGQLPSLINYSFYGAHYYALWYDFLSSLKTTVNCRIHLFKNTDLVYIWYADAYGTWRRHDGQLLTTYSTNHYQAANSTYRMLVLDNISGLIIMTKPNASKLHELIAFVEYSLR
ncbi:MAG: hypothetical protein QXE80_03440 [Pyrobaculum sp.]